MNILIFGLFALGFNLCLRLCRAALLRPCGLVRASAPTAAASPSSSSARPGSRRCRSACVVAGACGGGDRLVRDAHARHLLRHGDAGAVAVVYYIVFQGSSLTGGENGLRGVNVPAVDLFGLRINLLDPTHQILRHPRLRGRRAGAVLAHPQLAVRRRHRGDARERAAGARLRLRRDARALACLRPVRRCSAGWPARSTRIHLSVVPIETLHYFNSGLVRDDDACSAAWAPSSARSSAPLRSSCWRT